MPTPSHQRSQIRPLSPLYRSLKQHQLRLVRFDKPDSNGTLCCTLNTVPDLSTNYLAISYTWGQAEESAYREHIDDTEVEDCLIKLNGHSISVTPNLYLCLQELRSRYTYEYLWIDAICINQSDEQEKANQVNRMGDIYRSAAIVVVWLGPANFNTPRVRDMVEQITAVAQTKLTDKAAWESFGRMLDKMELLSKLGLTDFTEDELLALMLLLQRRWFFRVWTFQEVALARKLRFFCGKFAFKWSELLAVAQVMSETCFGDVLAEIGQRKLGTETKGWMHACNSRLGLISATHDLVKSEGKSPLMQSGRIKLWTGSESRNETPVAYLMEFAASLRQSKATDPRDHVYGLLGIVSVMARIDDRVPVAIEVDYKKSIWAVYTEVMSRYLTEKGSLTMLGRVQSYNRRTIPDLPSWVMDFTLDVPNSFLTRLQQEQLKNRDLTSFDACKRAKFGFTISQDRIQVKVCQFAKISIIGDSWDELRTFKSVLEQTAALAIKTGSRISTIADFLWKLMTCFDLAYAKSEEEEIRLRRSFNRFVLMSWVGRVAAVCIPIRWVGGVAVIGERISPMEALCTVPDLLALSRADCTGSIPSHNDVLDFCDALRSHAMDPQKTSLDPWKQLEAEVQPWTLRAKATMHVRRPFLLDNGYIGLGPEDAKVGDELCILADGGRTPFVLHPAEEHDRPESKLFVGEAYVPGIMYGEAVDRMEADGNVWTDIELI